MISIIIISLAIIVAYYIIASMAIRIDVKYINDMIKLTEDSDYYIKLDNLLKQKGYFQDNTWFSNNCGDLINEYIKYDIKKLYDAININKIEYVVMRGYDVFTWYSLSYKYMQGRKTFEFI